MIRPRPSPNADDRGGCAIDMLILHYTGMVTGVAALDRLTDPDSKVSCHYLIDEDGACYRLVDEAARAWHAGVGFWAGARDLNARSIGIELVNPGHDWGYRPFPPAQMRALARLCSDILARHPIPSHRVLGHSDVAPHRKQDPGEFFDWAWLAAAGIGLWPGFDAPPAPSPTSTLAPTLVLTPALTPTEALRRIGYGPLPETAEAPVDPALITAFQRHFRPNRVDGLLDGQTIRRLAQVASAIP